MLSPCYSQGLFLPPPPSLLAIASGTWEKDLPSVESSGGTDGNRPKIKGSLPPNTEKSISLWSFLLRTAYIFHSCQLLVIVKAGLHTEDFFGSRGEQLILPLIVAPHFLFFFLFFFLCSKSCDGEDHY